MTDEGLAEVYARIRTRVWSVCFAILRDRDEADDATQETFARMVAKADDLRDDATGYALHVARNVCRDELRRRVHRRAWAMRERDAVGPSVEDVAVDRQLIAEAWSRLSADERPVLADTARGLSLMEMAAARGITVAAMAQRVRRARMRIREFIASPGIAVGPGYAPVDFLRERVRLLLSAAGRRAPTPVFDAPTTAVPLLFAALAGGLATPATPATATPTIPPTAINAPARNANQALDGTVTGRIPPAAAGAAAPLASAAVHQSASVPIPAVPAVPPGVQFVSFTPSPQYQNDHRIFAVATASAACGTSCSGLYRSDDAGHSWHDLGGQGLGSANLMLPPDYPADQTMFAINQGTGLLRSDDGGSSFSVVVPATDAQAAIDPTSTPGDARVLMLPQRGGVIVVYDAASRKITAGPKLAADVDHVDLVFSVAGAPGAFVAAQGPISGPRLYSCSATQCSDVGPSPGVVPTASLTFATDHTFFVATGNGVEVSSVDGSQSRIVHIASGGTPVAVLPAADYATSGHITVVVVDTQPSRPPRLVSGLVSAAGGLQGGGAGLPVSVDWHSLLRLPDGRIIAAFSNGGLFCSTTEGANWSAAC